MQKPPTSSKALDATSVDIGGRLRSERERCRMTQAGMAERTGVTKTTQFNYESGKRSPDALYLLAAAKLGLNIGFIVTGEALESSDDVAVIPLLNVRASAGNGTVNEPDGTYEIGGLCFSRAWLARRNLVLAQLRVIEVRGDSMEGVLSDGDRVLIDLADTAVRSGAVFVIRQGDELLVKRCQLLPGGIMRIISANPDYLPYEVDLNKSNDVAIVGRVVASVHQW